MARATRKSFPDFNTPVRMPKAKPLPNVDETSAGAFGFFREIGVRETIESIALAIILAFIFRVFLAEAFIIPTGSMAPSLKGAHKEITCDESGVTYAVGDSTDSRSGPGLRTRIASTFCPITQYETAIRLHDSDQMTFSGDRIIVNKFIYDFKEPERYDVIVFKNPNNGKQNFIKRLIGLPGDNILIENGDIYLMHQQPDGSWKREITRKPPAKLRTTLQVVDDTYHIGKRLKQVGWPSRWQQFRGKPQWSTVEVGGRPMFATSGSGDVGWLRYRHFRPRKSDWNTIKSGQRPAEYSNPSSLPAGKLITDHYAYNDVAYNNFAPSDSEGLHWVGDIGVELTVNVKSASGLLMLDLVEGGAHFVCEIDVATGKATLSCDHEKVIFVNGDHPVAQPSATTRINRPGNYKIMYLNADDRIHLWVDDRLIDFDAPCFLRDEIPIPQYSEADPGDAEPIGIASQGLEIEIERLKVVRDLYYTSVKGDQPGRVRNETGNDENLILSVFRNPDEWSTPRGLKVFADKKGSTEPMFKLQRGTNADKDQFLPMGDNSPMSSDGRIWDGPHYVERDMLIGRAVFVYWPHMLNKPIPFFPNFKDMRFIR
jgi:signal peptidase I